MRAYTVLAVLVLSVCLAQQAQGWYYGGWGLGYGLGLGGYGLGWGWPYYRYFRSTMSEGDITNRIQCRWITEKNVLSCSGASGVVECGGVSNFTGLGDEYRFEMFGLARCDKMMEDKEPVMYKYNLYPRDIDNKFWYNTTFTVEENKVPLFLYHSNTYNFFGYRITDNTCFERFVSLFDTVTSYETIEVKDYTREIPLFGEILVHNKHIVA